MKFSVSLLLALLGHLILPRALMADDAAASLPANLKSACIQHYAELLAAEYADSLTLALALQTNVETFLARPSAENLTICKNSWTACRSPYSQSEAARFYDGPIDGIEGFINAWPIDENYLDYTVAAPDAGIINQPGAFPRITADVILDANAKEGDKTISTGFHAIEFLLWGQDLYADGPGRRSHLDYVDAPSGPGLHAARRRQYLHLLAQLLVQHLQILAIQWTPNNPGNYRSRFVSLPPDEALQKIFSGVGNLSSSELRGERILVPYTTQSQENEQCCFSDTTQLDLVRNEIGIQNIFRGRYERADGQVLTGIGLLTVLEKSDARLARDLEKKLAASVVALQAIPPPFDQALLGEDSAPGRVAIQHSLAALQAQTADILKAAAALHLSLNLK